MENSPLSEDKKSPQEELLTGLIRLIERLRGDNGCPWDQEQTPRSIAAYLVEEVYELIDAINSGIPDDVLEELGDVLFHIFFIAHLFQEEGHFNILDVVRNNKAKMVRRHPHIFSNQPVKDIEEIRKNWHQIKKAEKRNSPKASLLDSVPAGGPALMRAYRISECAAGAGFDWDDIEGVMQKVTEELVEMKQAILKNGNQEKNNIDVSLEFGDVLFTLVNVARFARIHPETALAESIQKFKNRFQHMEAATRERERPFESLSRQELDNLWEEAKKAVKPT